jgi:hypothetical protein
MQQFQPKSEKDIPRTGPNIDGFNKKEQTCKDLSEASKHSGAFGCYLTRVGVLYLERRVLPILKQLH